MVIVIRDLARQTHRALQARAARHGRSTEAEARQILDETVVRSGGSSWDPRSPL
jgi:plasmid stability protein